MKYNEYNEYNGLVTDWGWKTPKEISKSGGIKGREHSPRSEKTSTLSTPRTTASTFEVVFKYHQFHK